MRTDESRAFWSAVEVRLDGRPWVWLAARLGLTKGQFESWRRGMPRTGHALSVARSLGVELADLL